MMTRRIFVERTRRAAAVTAVVSMIAAGGRVAARVAASDARWGAGYFPNVTLTTHEGQSVRFYDDVIKGKIVAIDLIYTSCQYACPLETARLVQVQRLLGDRVGRDIFFYSITIDPDHDSPEVLKAYAEKYRVGPGWLFLTGKARDIELISRKLGLYTEPDPSDPDGHTPMLLVGNERTGQWMRNSALDNPRFLASTIGDWLTSWDNGAKQALRSFAEVPEFAFDEGQYTFKNHCAACHTIGAGDALGPDLRGVTSARDRQWLARFIATPDKLFADHDPIAEALLARYTQVRMPNLSLSDHDATVLIDYIARESARSVVPSAHALAVAVPPAPPRDLTALIEPYLHIQRALAADSVDGIVDHAIAIATEAVTAGSRGAAIKLAVNPFAQVDDVRAARAAFGPLSDAIIAYVRTTGASLGRDVHVANCPMARKYWLQKGETIANPYYGKQMVDCGRILADLPAPAR